MGDKDEGLSIDVFSTCPASATTEARTYIEAVVNVARWSEHYGCKGILVYTDNSLVDPWLVADIIIQHTTTLSPLIAIQPVYAHPYMVAKMVASLGYLYNRRIYLNMVAGGFTNDLTALNDTTPHDKRYDRLREYTLIIKELLNGGPVSFSGAFYTVEKLRLAPPLPSELFPGVFMSASSQAGLTTAQAVGATAVHYPKRSSEYQVGHGHSGGGMRIGIIAREDEDESWAVARLRFPADRKGQVTHQLAVKASDSVWHRELSETAAEVEKSPYWLGPFQNYKTFCPYLVGSYGQVGNEIARYIAAGYRTFILDIPPSAEELEHTKIVFDRAVEVVAS